MAASFIKNEQGVREVILGIMHGRITGKIQAGLKGFDLLVSECEQWVYGGTAISVSGTPGKIQISKDDLEEHLGADLFEELKKLATNGRDFLQKLGFESKVRVAPATLMGKDPMTASAMVSPYEVENPGDPPIQGMKISTFGPEEKIDESK